MKRIFLAILLCFIFGTRALSSGTKFDPNDKSTWNRKDYKEYEDKLWYTHEKYGKNSYRVFAKDGLFMGKKTIGNVEITIDDIVVNYIDKIEVSRLTVKYYKDFMKIHVTNDKKKIGTKEPHYSIKLIKYTGGYDTVMSMTDAVRISAWKWFPDFYFTIQDDLWHKEGLYKRFKKEIIARRKGKRNVYRFDGYNTK